jgi:hypothetical protein|tara:strand:- start:282 stop:554 length:273 start_codon:yes stop_codon:yes gene_type:complete
MKSLFIRCSQETYELAHALAKKENRSLNKQIIHMIHNEADTKKVSLNNVDVNYEDTAEQEGKNIYSGSVTSENTIIGKGLSGLVETKKQD